MIVILVTLMVVILGLTVVAVGVVGERFVRQQIATDLQTAARVFERFFADRVVQLMHSTELLSGDFAFKQAYGNGDRDTLYSAVRNLQQNRLSASLMLLLDDEDLSVVVDTRQQRGPLPEFPHPELITEAETKGEPAWSLEVIDQQLVQLVVVPLLAPEPVAWIVVGFAVDDAFALTLKELTRADLTFVSGGSYHHHGIANDGLRNGTAVQASVIDSQSIDNRQIDPLASLFLVSTLDPAVRKSNLLAAQLATEQQKTSYFFTSEGSRYAGLELTLADNQTRVVLQRSVEFAMQPFIKLYRILSLIAVVGLIALIVGVAMLARQITHPVQQLAASTHRVQQGDYTARVDIHGHDEIAQLATAFNQMTQGLAAFQRYVPTQLVRTLIDKGIESVPQSRIATMVYTDIENFTSVAEKLEPQRLVELLNDYFTAVTVPINQYQGVITQYQGDAILVVFNLTGDDPDHASNAIRAAKEIQEILDRRRFGTDQLKLSTRIGINTGTVVAGSVGSAQRMNYTVHGDSVNLAARLETLNKQYGTRVLTSEFTIEVADPTIERTKIGSVQIEGKTEPVTVFRIV